ncbi:sensor histidine kinase [Bombilactobacillus folatiphilus]|uniref:histidine kinase n=1 Tax=Bombilactobacillus folatiphilus TaxID=2923362 RepID=A0ABY4P742_9LACO|nr:sensor histidine kinase [Bombilactobacillus folatiphilus]UQS81450.1 sensor histidine kinase [Bombilactobacillus folatiphilus]
MALLLLLFGLYHVRLIIWWDLLRFSFLFIIAQIVWQIVHQKRNLKRLVNKHSMWPPVTLIEREYQQQLQSQVNQQVQKDADLQRQFRQYQVYLINWAHEIKVPITDLLILSEDSEQVSSRRVREQTEMIQQQLETMLNYDRLLDFQHDLRFTWVDLSSIVIKIIQKYATFFIKFQIQPLVEVESVKVLTDSKWLQTLLEQVIFNALKYSSSQSQIKIQWQNNTLLIIDAGVGIVASELPRIFEPGFTGQNGRDNQSSTGMGLYLAQQISHKLNLRLNLSSKVHQGTTVCIVFPAEHVQHIAKL